MASTTSNAAFNVASVGASGTAHRSVQEDFERLPGNNAPTVAMIGYGSPVKVDEGFKFQRIVDRDLPQTITITAQLPNTTSSGTTLTASTTDIAALQEGQTLLIEDEIVRVTTAGTSTTAAITRAFAGTTIGTHVTSVEARIMSPTFLDTATFVESAKSRGEFKSFYPTQIMYEWSQTAMRTAVSSYLTKGQDELTFEKANKMKEAERQLEMLMWYSKAQAPTGSNIGMFDGISRLVSTNVTTASAILSGKLLNDTLELALAWDNNNNAFNVYGNRNMKRIWDNIMRAEFDRRADPDYVGPVKVRVDRFETSLGTLNFVIVPNLKDGELYFLKEGDIKLRPLDVAGGFSSGWQEFTREPEHTNALSRQMAYYWLGTLDIGDERRHCKMVSITTTPGSYTGYI